MRKIRILLWIILLTTIDQITKVSICNFIPKGTSIDFLSQIVKLTHIINTGIAYGMRKKQ